jgi:hypothetical protein
MSERPAMSEEPKDTTVGGDAPSSGGVTWAGIYESPQVDRSSRG